ncbi:MAG: CinA family protein [Spirochaetaceae bacterium]|jgi:PncC family amidohydrolase|nr:CinA family protein [Spirochaetaceae bacterium]
MRCRAEAAGDVVRLLREKGLTLALAESCTAGLVADSIACVPGASNVFWGSFVSYRVEAKAAMLGIDRTMVERYGVVSGETARMMAEGALEKSGASLAASVTGLAGPDGDDRGTPVGTVWMAVAVRENGVSHGMSGNVSPRVRVEHFCYEGDRATIREAAAVDVLKLVLSVL